MHPLEDLRGKTVELANHFKGLSPVAVGLSKILVDRSRGDSVESGLEYEAQAQSLAFAYLMEQMRKK